MVVAVVVVMVVLVIESFRYFNPSEWDWIGSGRIW